MKFKNWFESNEQIGPFPGSTVPYLVYHGTDKSPFKQFAYQKSQRFVMFASFDVEAKGFFFSESPHDALDFGQNVVSCYINLRNPLLDPRRDKHLGVDRLSWQQEIDLQKILAPMIEKDQHGHFMDVGVARYYIKNRHREFGRQWIYDAIESDGLNWDALDNPGVVQRMLKLGYDGTFVAEPNSYLGRSIFVPSPDQVRMVQWVTGMQQSWGDRDDYFTTKKDGLRQLNRPDLVVKSQRS